MHTHVPHAHSHAHTPDPRKLTFRNCSLRPYPHTHTQHTHTHTHTHSADSCGWCAARMAEASPNGPHPCLPASVGTNWDASSSISLFLFTSTTVWGPAGRKKSKRHTMPPKKAARVWAMETAKRILAGMEEVRFRDCSLSSLLLFLCCLTFKTLA